MPTLVRCLAVLVLVAATSARADTVLSFDAPVEVLCNEEAWIDIVADAGAIDLRGHSLLFYTDPSKLEVVDFAAGTLFDDASCDTFVYGVTIGLGLSQVDIAGLGCSVEGPGSIARVLVRGLANGVSPLLGASATLRTSANAPIGATWTDGAVMVTCPIPTDESTWGTLKGRFR